MEYWFHKGRRIMEYSLMSCILGSSHNTSPRGNVISRILHKIQSTGILLLNSNLLYGARALCPLKPYTVLSSCTFLISSLGGSTSGPKLSGNNSPMVLTIHAPSLLNMKDWAFRGVKTRAEPVCTFHTGSRTPQCR